MNPYEDCEEYRENNRLTTIVIVALLIFGLVACASVGIAKRNAEAAHVVEMARLPPGRPLDAVARRPPEGDEFADSPCYQMMDRATGKTWWLVKMADGQWVTLED